MNSADWEKMFASTWKREGNPFIQFLLDAGLDVNAMNKYGTTMLSYSAKWGILQIAEFLVHKGADADVANSDSSKPIHIAAQYGCTDIVKFFLKKGVFVDSFDNEKCTALHYVAILSTSRERYHELVNILVDHNADIDAVDSWGDTPMIHAARGNRKHMVELFIKLGANLEYCDEYQWTILHHACQKGWTGIVRTLVKGRFEIHLNAKTSNGSTPVILAAKNSHEDIVELLIKLGADLECCDENQWTVLHHACRNGWTGIVRTLVKGKFEIHLNAKTSNGSAFVILAAKNSHGDIVELLIKSGAEVEHDDDLLHCACEKGWLEVMKSLVSKGCDFNSKDSHGRTLLFIAALFSHLSVVEYLIECGADVSGYSENGWTMLHCSCYRGWLEVVKFLVSKGCDFNAKDCHGKTPLFIAADSSHLSVVEYLMACGADVNGCNENGWTMMHRACKLGWLEVVKSLLSKECNFNAKDSKGRTPLHIAAEFSCLSVVEYLIECGADVNGYSENGWTMLHYSCSRGWLSLVKSLIKKGSNFNARTVNNDTPLYLAIENCAFPLEIIKYLLNAGADCNVVNVKGKTALNRFVQRQNMFYKEISLEVITLFLRSGAYFQTEDFAEISNNSFLKKGILQNIYLCTVALINSYLADLSKIYEIPLISGRLPRIEKLKIVSLNIEEDIAESVTYEIQTKGYCYILNAHPIVSSRLCVLTLVKHYNS